MKRHFLIAIIAAFFIVAPALIFAQAPPHPNNGAPPSSGPGGNTPVGAGAPITDGSFILLTMALAYAARKIYVVANLAKE